MQYINILNVSIYKATYVIDTYPVNVIVKLYTNMVTILDAILIYVFLYCTHTNSN
jgi:hypothetical protein